MEFLRNCIRPEEIFNKDILEVGSQDINGSPREVIAPLGPRTYWGVDYGPGKSVDLVLDATKIVGHFGKASFDVVVSTEMLEHAEDWKTSITQMKEVLRPGGTLILSARGPGFPYHGFPHDYWRYTVDDFRAMFRDMKIEICKNDTAPGVLFKGTKTDETGRADLSNISIEPIVVPPEMIKVDGCVDLIVANWKTYPWLRLLVSQFRRFHPRIPTKLFVWDNASRDGSVEWLKREGIAHHESPVQRNHGDSLHESIQRTTSPYIAFLDVDAIPVQWWWLDQAVGLLQEDKVGIVGLGAGDALRPHHRKFVHPSFSVFRRELYERLILRPHIVHDYTDKKTAFDVGETMSARVEDEGYGLRFVGDTHIDLAQKDTWKNRVIHCGSSTPVLGEMRTDAPFVEMVNAVVRWHRALLSKLGIWEEFEAYAGEGISKNPLCVRYVDKRAVPSVDIRLSIVIPTLGRESLRSTLESIERGGILSRDEVIVVGDGPQPGAEAICGEFSSRIPVRFFSTRETKTYGGHQRNVGMGLAIGSHLLFIDDDDCYRPGALEIVRNVVAQASDRLHLFRIENSGDRHPFKSLWNDKEFRLGNVGTQMICVPIVDGLLGAWTNGHCSDFGFLSDTIPRFGLERIIWRDEVIVEVR